MISGTPQNFTENFNRAVISVGIDFSHTPPATYRHILISIPLISTKKTDCVGILKCTQIAFWLQAILRSTTTYTLMDNTQGHKHFPTASTSSQCFG